MNAMELLCNWLCPLPPRSFNPRSYQAQSYQTLGYDGRSLGGRSPQMRSPRRVTVDPVVRIRWVPRATAHGTLPPKGVRGVPRRRVTRALRPDIVRYTSRDPENTW